MKPDEQKELIRKALATFNSESLDAAATALFKTLGYVSERDPGIKSLKELNEEIFSRHEHATAIRKQADLADWNDASLLFQLTSDDISAGAHPTLGLFKTDKWNRVEILSYLFMAV